VSRIVVYSPNDIVSLGTKYLDVRRNQKHQAIPIGIPSLDKEFLPLLPTELCTIIGRPGNGKTGLMMAWARNRATWLRDNGLNDRMVVYATWEQSIEELYAFNLAADQGLSITEMARGNITDDQWEQVMRGGSRRLTVPLWFVGHSVERRKARPNLTMTALMDGLHEIEDWGDKKWQIDMVFVDYLQRVKFEGRVESKTIGVSDNLDRCKDGALETGCPWVVGVQAGRDVDERADPTPQLSDGQWTSNIEQASDAVLSVVRPRKYRDDGERFPGEDGIEVRGHTQMLITVCKRKLGPDNWAKWVTFDPAYNKLDEAEVREYDFTND
jgi:replicative DNA helicase